MNRLWLTLLISAPLWAQVTDPGTISWNNPTENADGSPLIDLAGVRLTCLDSTGQPQFTFETTDPATEMIDVMQALTAAATGIEYRCTVQAFDNVRNFSIESNEVVWSLSDQMPPKPPTGLGVS